MKRPTKKEREQDERQLRHYPVNNFICCEKVMPFKEFKEHLIESHKLLPEQMKGKKQMLMHMDGDYWSSSEYQWELESGLKFTQYIKMARSHDDPMRHG